jgi:hypothetical protein
MLGTMIWALPGNVPMSSADDDPRSDRACDEMVDLKDEKMQEQKMIQPFQIVTEVQKKQMKVLKRQ